jgi:glycerol-3-phosphate dehydrogenase
LNPAFIPLTPSPITFISPPPPPPRSSAQIRKEDVKAAWSGIRPLLKDPKKLAEPGAKSSQLSRSHVVEVSPSGMVSILGGKWTTYRRMAEEAIDAFASGPAKAKAVAEIGPSRTLTMQLLGADRAGIVINKKYDRIPVTLREVYGFDKETAKHLSMNYGTRAVQVAEIAKERPALSKRIAHKYPFIRAEVVFACDQEYAETVVDVLARRTRLAFLDAKAGECVWW